jgi:integrase
VTGVETLRDITAEIAVAYSDDVGNRENIAPKQQAHLFTGVRRLLTFAKSRAMAVDEIVKILEYLKLMKADGIYANLNPQPIEVDEFQSLLKAAEGHSDNTAMVLLMLNCALYLGELIRLKWTDFRDGCLVTRREKKGRCIRVAVLWPETVAAMNQLERKGEFLFYNYRSEPIKICGMQRRFWNLADKAVVCATASQLRDGAYTAAVENNINADLCKILVGHSCGLADAYVLRNPKMVAPAVEAIRRKYLG